MAAPVAPVLGNKSSKHSHQVGVAVPLICEPVSLNPISASRSTTNAKNCTAGGESLSIPGRKMGGRSAHVFDITAFDIEATLFWLRTR